MKKPLPIIISIIFFLFSHIELSAQQQIKMKDIIIEHQPDSRVYAHKKKKREDALNGDFNIKMSLQNEYILASFKEGFANGVWKHYTPDTISELSEYKDGYLQGKSIKFYSNGNMRNVVNYHKGKVHGESIDYYPNRKVKHKMHMYNGKLNGLEHFFDKNEKLISETNYVDGKPEGYAFRMRFGDTIRFDYKINISYRDGKQDGAYSEVYLDSIVMVEGMFEEGKKQGSWTRRTKQGTPTYTDVFEENKLVKKITYHDNGGMKTEKTYKDGKLNGIVREFTIEGKPKFDYYYEDNKQVGKQTTYFTSNNSEFIGTAYFNQEGLIDGAYIEKYVDKDIIKLEAQYVNGQKEGNWIYRDLEGDIVKEELYKDGQLIRTNMTSKSLEVQQK